MSDSIAVTPIVDDDPDETHEWLESLEYAMAKGGPKRVRYLLDRLEQHARFHQVDVPFDANTPYVNTIPVDQQPAYPGDREIERRIKSIVRWNAMAIVVRANRIDPTLHGHVSSFGSSATLFEVAQNHFLRGKENAQTGDQVYFQGHTAPGMYARAFVEGRLNAEHLENFRRELKRPGGLSSYPHPWLMPDFWEYPTVSMGLAPIMGIYQARFNRYLEDRGHRETSDSHVWVFMGDGETDEPESLGAITLAARERLDNLIFVINCNLQRLDGPVRGNGKVIQELERAFRGAGWNVIKVIWGSDWDPLLAKDTDGALVERMNEAVDGHFQKYSVESGDYIRNHFFGEKLQHVVSNFSDEQLQKMRRGGHDPEKVYAAYKAAVEHTGQPTVILAKTIKGYGLGEAGEGRNTTHQQHELNEAELREFRTRFDIPITDEALKDVPFYRPPEDSPESVYLRGRRNDLGGFVPSRQVLAEPLQAPSLREYTEFFEDTGDRDVSTTMVFARLFGRLVRNEEIGKLLVPIIPDEARTFGMEPLFRQIGIYSHVGQLYEPVDAGNIAYYREAKDGQLLEEGINEAGAMSSFIAAGTAYSAHGVNTIPFFTYYSMFGFQRIGDLIWAAADCRCRGFLLGGTAGRTTLNGEGLQHQDGHSHVLASTVPTLRAYDPAFAYEIAVIIEDGIKRMYQDQEDCFYYLTLGNEAYPMPAMPEGVEEGILRGIYKLSEGGKGAHKVQLFGSGAILKDVVRAQALLADRFNISADVWSVTSYKELRQDALAAERWNMLHPTESPRKPYITEVLENAEGPIIAASDYMKVLPDMIRPWVPEDLLALGTDGFGRSETREALRRHFEVDAESIALGAIHALAKQGRVKQEDVKKAIDELGIDPEKADPASAGPVLQKDFSPAEV
ncbi:MAG: pyruvate dehydrogenase (acetyl-transferring), homodimeric type [Gemmatimonadetes bacterium]|nr:pyruvate dehydrogenase (acetyl-transferring), homodimeric type [Gemmatimonadota bacterium]|tara:strand:+ start:19949 stop:22657 length:2709 start_codon:yes stop_codon:yes gene_type:complete